LIGEPGMSVVEVNWIANPFRAEKFAAAWKRAAEAALDYGALGYSFMRSKDDRQHFTQLAFFETRLEWERYWNSQEIAEARIAAMGLYQIPVTPVWYELIAAGQLRRSPAAR
jgi:hypothetical protein